MNLNLVFELSMILDTDHFQKIFSMAYDKSDQPKEIEDGWFDLSMTPKGITVIFRNSQYKKKVQLLVNSYLLVDDLNDTEKLIRKLDKRIAGYFGRQYQMNDFTLSGAILICDIDVHSHGNAVAYTKVLQRIGKVKGFSSTSFDSIDDETSFCLSGNSNAIDFLLYDLETALMAQLHSTDMDQDRIPSISGRIRGTLRAEVRLTKPKAIRAYTETANTSGQIAMLSKNCQSIFLDTFTRVIPYGDFYKKDRAIEIIHEEVESSIMQKRMLRLVALVPEKKSLHLAQKSMNCRNIDKVMETFAKINLSPVTISKRHDVKCLKNLYSFF